MSAAAKPSRAETERTLVTALARPRWRCISARRAPNPSTNSSCNAASAPSVPRRWNTRRSASRRSAKPTESTATTQRSADKSAG